MSPVQNAVRVGVLGTGAIAQVAHLPILSRMKGVELAAVYDADRSKAKAIADRLGVSRVHRSEDDLWSDPELDAVIVCTPSHLHEAQVREGISSGKYVFCEKPLALSAEGARRTVESEGADSRLVVGMNQRFRPDAVALKSFMSGRELGDVFYLRAGWLNRRIPRNSRSWRQRKTSAGGGALMDLGLQMLDLCLWTLDYPEPERIVAHLHGEKSEVEDSAVLLLHLEGGRTINLEVTWSLVAERERQYMHLFGTSGSGSLGPLKVYKELDSGLLDVTPQLAPGRENPFTASYRLELAHFMDVVRGEAPTRAPVEQITLMRIIEGAYRSAEEGREIDLRA